jgi:hypothetical protein
MMESVCPECGAAWREGRACEEAFYQMGYWEMDNRLLEVHHLMVLCYYLQHPSLYSPEGLREAQRLLVKFVAGELNPQEVVKQNNARLDSGVRTFKIKGTPAAHGAYPHAVHWTMTAVDVVNRGMHAYYASVHAWAQLVLKSLQEAGNL